MDIPEAFNDTMLELMQDKPNAQLSEMLGISTYGISKLRHKKTNPKLHTLLKIADAFDCSVEFLCGKTDAPLDFTPQPCPPFSVRLPEILRICRVPLKQLYVNKRMTPSQYYYWRTGKTEPLLTSLDKLATELRITIDALIGRERL